WPRPEARPCSPPPVRPAWPRRGRATSSPGLSPPSWPRACRPRWPRPWPPTPTAPPPVWGRSGAWSPATCSTYSPGGSPVSRGAAVVDGAPVDPARRRGWAEVDLGAVRHNAALLARTVAPAQLCAVVKANGYGHGSAAVAQAALAGGARWLAVAVVEEGAELRDAGIDAPVLLLSEPPPGAMDEAVALGLTPSLYTAEGVEAASLAAARRETRIAVHVKVDTGMHRVGADPDGAVALALAVHGSARLSLGGFWTHLAVADEPAHDFTAEQLRRFGAVLQHLDAEGIEPGLVHAANSAGALAHPGSRHDLVRCGIALYGHVPSAELAGVGPVAELRPSLTLKARVALVRVLDAGERV